jgi:HEAT repeat protein
MMTQPVAKLLDDLQHGDELTQCEAAKALGEINDEAASLVVALLDTTESQDVRKWTSYALGIMGDVRAKPALVAALANGQNRLDVRCHAAEALGHLLPYTGQHEDAIAALRNAIAENEAELRFWTAFALGNIGSKEDVPILQELAATDDRQVPHWWSVSKEAASAVDQILNSSARQDTDSLNT